MDEKVKNYLGVSISVAVLILALVAVGFAYSYSRSIQPDAYRSFAVSGEGKAVGIPDVARFTFSVITEGGKRIADLQRENTEKMNRIINFIKSNGVESKDIRTENYNLTPRYQNFDCISIPMTTPYGEPAQGRTCPPPEIVGYTINQTALVKVRDFDKIGALLSGAVDNGANSVSQLAFEIDDPANVENQARAEAISQAKEKAKAMADAGDFRLGKLLSIEEGYSPPMYDAMSKAVSFEAPEALPLPAPTIEAGSQEVRVNVMLRYEIKS